MVKREIAELTDVTANTAITRKIMSYKSGVDLSRDQVAFIRSVFGQNKLDKFGNKLSSADQLLAYLESRPNVSYMAVADKLVTKLLSVGNKGCATKSEQKILQIQHMSIRQSQLLTDAILNPNEPVVDNNNPPEPPVEQELAIPDDDPIILDAKETREALRVKDTDQILLAVAFVCDDES